MRIIYLHQYFNTPKMPGGTRSFEMARRLVARGHQVELITSNRAPETINKGWYITSEAGITVHWLSIAYSNQMGYAQRIQAFLRFASASARRATSLSADVIFATSTPLTIALPAIYAARKLKVPMVFEVRDLWPELPIAVGALRNPVAIWAAKWLEKLAYKNAAQIVVLSPGMYKGVVKSGYLSEYVHVIPNSCDLELFSVSTSAGLELRKRYAWLQGRPLVLYTGTLGVINGVDYLAKLAAVVKHLDPEIRFLVVGNGKQEAQIREVANTLGVLDINFFMMSSVPKQQIPVVLSAATLATSLFIDLPEMWANSANKFFDALASGTPVAINYGGWQADLLTTTGAGITLNPVNLEQSAALLIEKIRNPVWLAQAGQAAYKLAQEQFDRDILSKQLEAVLETAVKSSLDHR